MAACDSESIVAWDQLIKTGTIDSTLTITNLAIGQAQLVSTNLPASKIKFAAWAFDYRNNVGQAGDYDDASALTEGLATASAEQNVVVLTPSTGGASSEDVTLVNGVTNVSFTTANVGAITGPDALSIDTKIDDSFANAGKVRGLNPGATTVCYTLSANTNVTYEVGSGTSKVCNLTFQVDVNS